MLTVWGRRSSSNVQAVMWAAAELGLPVERIDAGLTYGVTGTAEYRQMNPNDTVPTVRDQGGPPLWESGAILRYLAARYGSESFWPSAPEGRAPVDMWAEWAKLNVAIRFTGPVFWRVVRTAPSKRDPEAIASGIAALTAALKVAEPRLAKGWLAGEAFTLADILFGHVLYRYFDIDIARQELPGLAVYYRRLRQRPAFRDHVMVSYDELRVVD